jgi:hypothetical protein
MVMVAAAVPVTVVTVPPAKTGRVEPAELIPLAGANDPTVPRLARPAAASTPCVEGADDTIDASGDDDDLASPTRIPPETMIVSKTTATSAFLERMVCFKGLLL